MGIVLPNHLKHSVTKWEWKAIVEMPLLEAGSAYDPLFSVNRESALAYDKHPMEKFNILTG
jgi:hypothetical protein